MDLLTCVLLFRNAVIVTLLTALAVLVANGMVETILFEWI